MVNIDALGTSPPVDTTSKGGRSDKGGGTKRDFLDALTDAHDSSSSRTAADGKSRRPTSDADVPGGSDPLSQEAAELAVPAGPAKPIIHLQKTSLRPRLQQDIPAQPDGQDAAADRSDTAAAAQQKMAKAVKNKGTGATGGDISAKEDDAKAEASGHAATSAKPTGRALSKGEGDDTAQAKADGAASDALSLLHGSGDATASAQSAAAALSSAHMHSSQTSRTSGDADRPATAKVAISADHAVHEGADDAVADTADTTTGTAGKAFKLVRADGRGQAMQMSVGKGEDDNAKFDMKASSGGSAETVTVLDSRRYLGLAQGSNSLAVINAMGGDSEWSQAMEPSSNLSNAASMASTGKVVNTLKIEMNPVELGKVTATMRLSGDQLTVDLKVQSGEAYRQLRDDQGRMIEALRAQGYSVDSITVTMAASDQADTNTQSGFQNQPQQQSLLNQGQDQAQSRGQNYSGQRANGNEGGWGMDGQGSQDGASGGSDGTRAGGVYL